MHTAYNVYKITGCARETARITGEDERTVKHAVISAMESRYRPTLDEQIEARRMVMESVDEPVDAVQYKHLHGEQQLSSHTPWMPVHMLAQKMGVASQTLRHSADEYGVEIRASFSRGTHQSIEHPTVVHHTPHEEARAPWSVIKNCGQVSKRWSDGRATQREGKTPWMQVSRMMDVLDLTERQIRRMARRDNDYGLIVTQNGGGNWFCCDEHWGK